MGCCQTDTGKDALHITTKQTAERIGGVLVVHCLGLELDGFTEHECTKVSRRTCAEGGHEKALLLLSPTHKFFDVFGRHFLRIDQQHKVRIDDLADRGKVLDRIVGQFGVGAGRDAQLAGFSQHERVTIRCSAGRFTGGDQASRTRLVVHDHPHIAPTLGQFLRQQSRHDIGPGASRKSDDQTHGARRILRLGLDALAHGTGRQNHSNERMATAKGSQGVENGFHSG